MHSVTASWLINALVIVGLAVLLWLVLSIPSLWVKFVLEKAGVYAFPGRVYALTQRLGFDGGAISAFFARADASMQQNGDQATVRVVLDERHQELRERLAATERSVRETVASVQGLAGQSGGTTFLTDFNALRERTKLVERLGVEISEDTEDDYAARRILRSQLMVLFPIAVIVAVANGSLLSVLFSEMTQISVFGLFPLAYGLGVVVVMMEVSAGIALYHFRKSRLMMVLMIALIVIMTSVEAFAMSVFSVEFSTSLRNADPSDATIFDYWLVLFALAFTPMTSILGYMLEETRMRSTELAGKRQFANELADCNRFVNELPGRWGAIEAKARSAEAAIGRYQDALGGQDERLAGAIDALAQERQKLSAALLAAKIEDWPNLVAGAAGDARHAAVQNILLCLLTVVALGVYAAGVAFLVRQASHWPLSACVPIGLGTALLFLVIGNLAFNRLRLVQGMDGRAQPMNAPIYHKALAGLLVAGAASGLIWACMSILGSWGIAAGIFVTALCGALSFLGYAGGRAGRGLVLIIALTTSFAVAAATALFAIIRYTAIWLLAGLAWLVGTVVALLAKPAEWIVERLQRKPVTTVAAVEPAQ